MTPQQIEAMKMALEALKLLTDTEQTFGALDYGDNAITALEEVLAEHAMQEVQRLGQEIEQTPYSVQQAYAMAQVCLDLHEAIGCKWGDNVYLAIVRLKAAAQPPQRTWVELTDEQVNEYNYLGPDMPWVVREVAAILKERNQ